jgi:hypothetical protein
MRGASDPQHLAGVLGLALLLGLAAPAAATGLTPSPAKKPDAAPAGQTSGLPTGIYLRTASGFVPLTKGKITVTTADGVKRYFVPLGTGPLPEAAPPIQARDVLPADENYWLLKLRDDGQVFSWSIAESYFQEPIEFGPRFETASDDKVLTWNTLEPGLWAFVESALTSIAETCYPFRVLPAPPPVP